MPDEPEVVGAPPISKRSFVPTEEEMKKAAEAAKGGEPKKEIPTPEVTLFLMYGKLDAILTEIKTLNNMFQKAGAQNTSKVEPTPLPAISSGAGTVAQQQPVSQVKPTEQSPRVKEILAALAGVSDLLNISLDDTMFVILRPRQFLGSASFSQIAQIVRGLGGEYVSAGKGSHFKVPKAPPLPKVPPTTA